MPTSSWPSLLADPRSERRALRERPTLASMTGSPEADRGAPYDFGGAAFDLGAPRDREIVRFVLSQALFGEATGVYCGRSLYAAR